MRIQKRPLVTSVDSIADARAITVAVLKFFDISDVFILSVRLDHYACKVRSIWFYMLCNEAGLTYAEIAKGLGKRGEHGIRGAERRVRDLVAAGDKDTLACIRGVRDTMDNEGDVE